MDYAIEMTGITKRFGDLIANDNIDFKVKRGEIHALVGENGAGKTTLMNVLYGMYQYDAGTILINGKEKIINSPSDAISFGIGMVHQHFMLVGTLSVLENIILGDEDSNAAGFIDYSSAKKKLQKLVKNFSLNIDADSVVETLPVGTQQKIEILKILYRSSDIIIFDEPTAVLTPQETEELFELMKKLKSEGKTIILITHKLGEVISISDSVTVLRHGKKTGEKITSETSQEELAELIVGGALPEIESRAKSAADTRILEVNNITVLNDRKTAAASSISFEISKGEIFGIAGVEGNGQTELVEAINGLRQLESGKININGSDIISHIPADRHKFGIVNDFSLSENVLLGRQDEKQFTGGVFVNYKSVLGFTESLIDKYDIRPGNPNQRIESLSGGNQQKLVVSREISKESDLIVASHPTRGLDIKAAAFVHNSLIEERNSGKAVLLVSSDLTELLSLSDRIGVIYNGRIIKIFEAGKTSEKEIGLYMTGYNEQIINNK